MKFQKAAAVLGICTCLIGAETLPAMAEESQTTIESEQEEGQEKPQEKSQDEINLEKAKELLKAGKTEEAKKLLEDIKLEEAKELLKNIKKKEAEEASKANKQKVNTQAEKDSAEKEKVETEKTSEADKTSQSEKKDNTTDENEASEKETPAKDTEGGAADESEDNTPSEGEDESGAADESEDNTPSEGEGGSGTPDEGNAPDEGEGNTQDEDAENNDSTDSNEEIVVEQPVDDNQNADHSIAEGLREAAESARKSNQREKMSNDEWFEFFPSEHFWAICDKIKYNIELPIEDIPSFITQEMMIGALKCQDETGYPASVTIAQIIAESGYGRYGAGGESGQGLSYLAYKYNNLFGIKGTGAAGSVAMKTGEQAADGTRFTITAGFRVYNTYTECIMDRTEILDRAYRDLTLGVQDANTFAMKIATRWATSLNYGQSLIRIMEQYDLYRLDTMTLDEFSGMLGAFVNPCPGANLTSDFGHRLAPLPGASTEHKGIDLGTGEYNIPTYAAAAGTVTFAAPCGSAGKMVEIDHGNGLVTKYMHHAQIFVKEGETVEKGQQIGVTGSTGISTGNHLHFQVQKNGIPVDPMIYLGKAGN